MPAATELFHFTPSIAINYQFQGEGDIPVVLLHGFAASLVTWHDLRALFPGDVYRLYLLDLKGFGFSDKPRDKSYTMEDQAAIVRAFITRLGLTQVVLIGHSLGGGIALRVCLQLQESQGSSPLSRLILMDCAAYLQQLPRFMGLMCRPLLGTLMLTLIPARLIVSHVLRKTFCNQTAITPERIERYACGFSARGVPYSFVTTVRQMVPANHAQVVASYATITVPTLIIWGRDDPVIGLAMGERLHKAIRNSTLAVIDDCGHNPHEERPEATYEVMSRFLSQALYLPDETGL